jgi:hypothetical protein
LLAGGTVREVNSPTAGSCFRATIEIGCMWSWTSLSRSACFVADSERTLLVCSFCTFMCSTIRSRLAVKF